jgi:hypothetical protein
MKIKTQILVVFIFIAGFHIGPQSLSGQSYFIPKIGVSLPNTSPAIGDIEINSENGLTFGLEYQYKSNKVNFNPGIYFARNNADLFQLDTIQGEVNRNFIGKTNHKIIKVVLGGEALLTNLGSNGQLNLRAAFVPTFKLGSPDYGDSGLDPDVQRGGNLEFLLGFGVDISRFVFDFDYNLSMLKAFRGADIVQNGFTISVGYKL